jgi:hypothetical protein
MHSQADSHGLGHLLQLLLCSQALSMLHDGPQSQRLLGGGPDDDAETSSYS